MDHEKSIRHNCLAALATLALLVGGVGGWAANAELAGAVVTSGTLVVNSHSKKVQHPTGGVVGDLLVREGDRVEAGQILLTLDETATRANLRVVEASLFEARLRLARLRAERDGRDAFALSPALDTSGVGSGELAQMLDGERILMQLRREAREGAKAQLAERVSQLLQEITGLEGQVAAITGQIALIADELEGLHELHRKNLVPITRITTLARDRSALEGDRSRLVAAIAQTRGRITEINLQTIQIDQDMRSNVAGDIQATEARIAELTERKIAAQDQLRRVAVRAPGDGIVHQVAVHTVGGVIGAGDTLMSIVPDQDHLVVEARIAPRDIERVHVSQEALMRFTAFDQRTTPQVSGRVTRVSPDLSTDPRTGASHFVIRLEIDENEARKLGETRLLPGMPVEIFMKTGARTALSYFSKPLTDHLLRAFREN